MRKLKIRKRLVDQMDGWRGERRYHPGEGLVVHWDWCLNVPKKYEKCKLTWGIFLKGTTLHRPKSVEDHLCMSDGHRVNYCMFGEHCFVYDIVANKVLHIYVCLRTSYLSSSCNVTTRMIIIERNWIFLVGLSMNCSTSTCSWSGVSSSCRSMAAPRTPVNWFPPINH